ncbi:hypothetical protein [Moorena sp. SIO3H5]|nr:hypothetical protein [Moorena sp. SIO3H5]NEO68489.1 hypothetical protein [Moorena sp. SIO3H5]
MLICTQPLTVAQPIRLVTIAFIGGIDGVLLVTDSIALFILKISFYAV